jgi:alpha-beta hydrolase superfamily lysophospholipase
LVVGRVSAVFAVLLAGLLWSASALAVAPQQLTIAASDGVRLACSLVEPEGAPPAGGWPAVMLFHGLGGRHQDLEPLAVQLLAPDGFAALECDARGTGASGGQFGLDGPRDVQDTRGLFDWLAGRAEISDTAIGAVGISLGGGAVWNAAAAGVPFKAIVPAIGWTDLSAALAPHGLPKSGLALYLAQLVPQARWQPDLLSAAGGLAQGQSPAGMDQLAAARSARPKLASLSVPTLLIQGRHDFFFDLDQALAAYRLLEGPKRLYLGDLGHAPATNPSAEMGTYLGEAVTWLDRYVKGTPNGIEKKPPVELAHDPWDGKTTVYRSLPPTKVAAVALPGTTSIKTGGNVVRGARLTGGPHETFGDSSVKVAYSAAQGWDRLVAVLMTRAGGREVVVSTGGTRLTAAHGTAKIALMNESVRVPAGAKLVVSVGATSLGQPAGKPLYVADVPAGSSITIGRETLRLSVLRRAVSR